MKKIVYLVLSLVLFYACSKDSNVGSGDVVISNLKVRSSDGVSANINFNVYSDPIDSVNYIAVCWSENPDPTYSDFRKESVVKLGNHDVKIKPLNPGQTYYVRVVAMRGGMAHYSNQIEFTASEIIDSTDTTIVDSTDTTITPITGDFYVEFNINGKYKKIQNTTPGEPFFGFDNGASGSVEVGDDLIGDGCEVHVKKDTDRLKNRAEVESFLNQKLYVAFRSDNLPEGAFGSGYVSFTLLSPYYTIGSSNGIDDNPDLESSYIMVTKMEFVSTEEKEGRFVQSYILEGVFSNVHGADLSGSPKFLLTDGKFRLLFKFNTEE